MSSDQILALSIGPIAMLATYACIRLTHAVLDFAEERFADEALSNDSYGNDRILGDWPRPAGDDEISRFHSERNTL